jgi:hypothetical protein
MGEPERELGLRLTGTALCTSPCAISSARHRSRVFRGEILEHSNTDAVRYRMPAQPSFASIRPEAIAAVKASKSRWAWSA